MKLLKFTDTMHRDIWIVAQWVTRVAHPVPNMQASGARTVIWMGANQQVVTEEPEQVVKMIEESA